MVKILREADRTPIAEVAKKHGVSEQTIYVFAASGFRGLISDLIVVPGYRYQTISRRASNQPGSRRSSSRRERNDFHHGC